MLEYQSVLGNDIETHQHLWPSRFVVSSSLQNNIEYRVPEIITLFITLFQNLFSGLTLFRTTDAETENLCDMRVVTNVVKYQIRLKAVMPAEHLTITFATRAYCFQLQISLQVLSSFFLLSISPVDLNQVRHHIEFCVVVLSWTCVKFWHGREEIVDKVIIFAFFAHKKYSRSFIKLRSNHWCHMDYFNNIRTMFLALNMVVAGSESSRISSKIS